MQFEVMPGYHAGPTMLKLSERFPELRQLDWVSPMGETGLVDQTDLINQRIGMYLDVMPCLPEELQRVYITLDAHRLLLIQRVRPGAWSVEFAPDHSTRSGLTAQEALEEALWWIAAAI